MEVLYNVEGEPSTVRVFCSRTEKVGKGTLHVLAIGISQYRDPKLTLNYAAKDAQDFVGTMQSQKGRQFADVQATLLINEDATQQSIRRELEHLKSLRVRPQDHVILFLSGHGGEDMSGAYCFVTADADVTQLRKTGLSWSEIRESVTDSNGKAFIFLDSCHAGGVAGVRVPASAASDAYNRVLRAASTDVSGVITFASCLPHELSFEDQAWKNGAFTKAIVEAVEGRADSNANGALTIAELELYVSTRVEELTQRRQSSCLFKSISVPSNLQIAVVK